MATRFEINPILIQKYYEVKHTGSTILDHVFRREIEAIYKDHIDKRFIMDKNCGSCVASALVIVVEQYLKNQNEIPTENITAIKAKKQYRTNS